MIPTLPAGKLELKYLFCAKFSDGTIIEQNSMDMSLGNPEKNCYYDLLELNDDGTPKLHEDGRVYTKEGIVLFQLDDGNFRYLVDLNDGHFEIQYSVGDELYGPKFFVSIPPKDKKLRPFWFLRRRQMFTPNNLQVLSQECEYHFGWETEDRKEKAEMVLV